MEFYQQIRLKDGRDCVLRSAGESDGAAVLESYLRTHAETDFLLSYPDENEKTAEQEARFLQEKLESPDEAEIVALVEGRIVGTAGIDRIGTREKVRHRASFGISVERAYWSLGIGRALIRACIQCAEKAGYLQLELEAVADNHRAIALYQSEGFSEYGRNPKGFRSRRCGWQEVVLMRRELV